MHALSATRPAMKAKQLRDPFQRANPLSYLETASESCRGLRNCSRAIRTSSSSTVIETSEGGLTGRLNVAFTAFRTWLRPTRPIAAIQFIRVETPLVAFPRRCLLMRTQHHPVHEESYA